jgi:hypothetical protein
MTKNQKYILIYNRKNNLKIMLAHFSNVNTSTNKYEILYGNLFEVTVILPTLVAAIHANATPRVETLLLENITNAKFPTYPELTKITQRFKYSTRQFLGTPDSTSADFDLTLNLNQNENNQVFCWRVLKDWYDLAWNNEHGSLHYKRNMLGDVIVHHHDKEGHIIRRVVYHNVQMNKISGWEELDFSRSSENFSLTVGFVCDWFEDFYY